MTTNEILATAWAKFHADNKIRSALSRRAASERDSLRARRFARAALRAAGSRAALRARRDAQRNSAAVFNPIPL